MAKVLRPVATFEQVVNQPVQLLDKPDRIISVSKPDPNILDFHVGQMQDQQHLMGMAAMHDLMMRQAAQQNGADIGAMRGLQASMMALQRSVDRATGAIGGNTPRPAGPRWPARRTRDPRLRALCRSSRG